MEKGPSCGRKVLCLCGLTMPRGALAKAGREDSGGPLEGKRGALCLRRMFLCLDVKRGEGSC